MLKKPEVLLGVFLFLSEIFYLDPLYSCGTDEVARCLGGRWNFEKRSIITLEKEDKKEKFAYLIDTVTAVKDIYISERHKLAIATEGDDIDSVDNKLTKGSIAPLKAMKDDLSKMTGNTKESKAKAHAAEESKNYLFNA